MGYSCNHRYQLLQLLISSAELPPPPTHTHTPSAPLPLLTLMEKTRAMMAQTTKGTPPQRIQKTRVQTEKLK